MSDFWFLCKLQCGILLPTSWQKMHWTLKLFLDSTATCLLITPTMNHSHKSLQINISFTMLLVLTKFTQSKVHAKNHSITIASLSMHLGVWFKLANYKAMHDCHHCIYPLVLLGGRVFLSAVFQWLGPRSPPYTGPVGLCRCLVWLWSLFEVHHLKKREGRGGRGKRGEGRGEGRGKRGDGREKGRWERRGEREGEESSIWTIGNSGCQIFLIPRNMPCSHECIITCMLARYLWPELLWHWIVCYHIWQVCYVFEHHWPRTSGLSYQWPLSYAHQPSQSSIHVIVALNASFHFWA